MNNVQMLQVYSNIFLGLIELFFFPLQLHLIVKIALLPCHRCSAA